MNERSCNPKEGLLTPHAWVEMWNLADVQFDSRGEGRI